MISEKAHYVKLYFFPLLPLICSAPRKCAVKTLQKSPSQSAFGRQRRGEEIECVSVQSAHEWLKRGEKVEANVTLNREPPEVFAKSTKVQTAAFVLESLVFTKSI